MSHRSVLKPQASIKKIAFILLFIPISLSAQDTELDTLKVKAGLSLSGLYQGGNVETIIFRAKANVSAKLWNMGVITTKSSYIYQEFGKEKADEDILSLNFISFNPKRRLFPFVLGFVSTNFRRQIDLRYILGAGFTYKLLTKKKNWLRFSVSSEFEQTDFKDDNFNLPEFDGSPTITTFRATFWLNGKHHLIKDKMIFGHESYVQPSLEQQNNFRWRTDLSLEMPIWKFLSFKVNYLYSFESVVIQGQKREDQFLTFGFSIKNY